MRHKRSAAKYVAFVLAVLALVASAFSARGAHAGADREVRASWEFDGAAGVNRLAVTGASFTAGGEVVIEVYQDHAPTPLHTRTTAASAKGTFSELLAHPTDPNGSFCPSAGVAVIAYDKESGDRGGAWLASNCPW